MKSVAIALSAITLAACGGGGGGGDANPVVPTPSAALNSSNQTIAAQDSASTAYLPLLGAQTLTGAQTFDEGVLFNIARKQRDKLPIYLADAKSNSALTGVVQSQTYSCTYGGTVTASVSDTDNNGDVSAGDSVTVTANNCVENEGTLTGSLVFDMNSVTGSFGSSNYSGNLTMTFNGFNVSSSQFSASANGALTLSVTASGVNSVNASVSTPSLSVSGTYAGVTRSRSLTNYSATSTRTPDSTYGYITSYTLNGTLTSSALGSQAISFATTAPFVSFSSDYYPSNGVMIISGAANSKVKVSALSNSQVKLELDANGDDAYEGSTMLDWNTLM